MLTFEEVSPEIAPMHLLLEADPSEKCIKDYLRDAWCFVARDQDDIVGVCIAKEIKAGISEIFNIAVDPAVQAQGIGKRLLTFTLSCLKDKQFKSVELGTGSFGYQLAFYQRQGFRVPRRRAGRWSASPGRSRTGRRAVRRGCSPPRRHPVPRG